MTRRWSLLTALLIVGIIAAGWFVLVSPKRSEASDLRSQATQQKASNDALVQQLTVLKAQSLDLPKQKAQLAVYGREIPDNPALPTLVRDLTTAGKKVGVQVVSMRPGAPTPIVVPVATPVAPPATTTDGTTTTDSTTTAAGATPAVVAAPAAPTLYLAPLGLTITGSYFEIEQFINKLEGMQRKFLVTGFALTPSTGAGAAGGTTPAGELSLELSGQVFLSPNVAATTTTPAVAPATAPAQ
jgi:Tfp pilus assembly protein PilO